MSKEEELTAIKKKRHFLQKSVKGSLKSVDEALLLQDNHARIHVLKDSIASKWNDLQGVQALLCTYLEDKEIDQQCESHREYELCVIEYMAKMTHYLESKHVAEMSVK